jgi:hypothetical protein
LEARRFKAAAVPRGGMTAAGLNCGGLLAVVGTEVLEQPSEEFPGAPGPIPDGGDRATHIAGDFREILVLHVVQDQQDSVSLGELV